MTEEEIKRVMPHREPMLFVDDILENEYGKSVVGIKDVRADEPWAQGHFPGNPIFPGVLMLETMTQIGCFVYYRGAETPVIQAVLSKVDGLKLLRPVVPGDRITVTGTVTEEFGRFTEMKCSATVNGKIVARAEITCCFERR